MTNPQRNREIPRGSKKDGGKQNAHIEWAFATSLDGLGVGCAGKI